MAAVELNEREKEQFAISTLKPMAEYTLPYLASVVGIHGQQTGEHIGSAIRIIINSRPAILTAHHVIQEAIDGRYRGFAISVGNGMIPYTLNRSHRIFALESSDLAVFFLPDGFPSGGTGTSFWPEERIDTEKKHRERDYLFVHGFPSRRSQPLQLVVDAKVINRSLPCGTMERLGLPADILNDFEFAVDYDIELMSSLTGNDPESLNPHAMSGCPVWRIGAGGGSVQDWSCARSKLVGIATKWRKKDSILIATGAAEILQLKEMISSTSA